MSRITMAEQETHVNFSRMEGKATVYTTDPTEMTKLRKLLKKNDTEWTLVRDDGDAMEVSGPKSLVSYRSKTVKRDLTDEQRQDLAERLQRARADCFT